MVKVAESLIKDDKDWQREVYEEAFQLARFAKVPFKRSVPRAGDMLGRNLLFNDINELGMDRLSLQCQALQRLVEVDRKRALTLLAELEPLELPITDCSEPYAPNVDAFYQMLTTLARQGFTSTEQAKSLDLDFVEPYLRLVTHPIQVTPAARLVRFLGTSPARLDRLLNLFLTVLGGVRNDDRAFSGVSNLPSAAELLMLGTFASQHGPRGGDVFAHLRGYLVMHLSGARCSDNVLTATGKLVPTPKVVRDFNQLIEHDQRSVEPITEDEIKPQSHAGKAAVAEFWQTPTAAKLKQRWYALLMGESRPSGPGSGSKGPYTLARPDRASAVWQRSVREFLQDISAWQPSVEATLADFYHQQSLLYARAYSYGGYVPSPAQSSFRMIWNFCGRAGTNSLPFLNGMSTPARC